MRIFVVMMFSLLLIGCGGYKPVANYSKNIFSEPVIAKVKIDPEDPSIGEYLQDEIIKMSVNRLNLSVTKNVNKAKSYILVNSYTINTTPETKDDDGNIIRYSINTAIEFAIKDKYGFWSKNIVASEFVSVKEESSVSQSAKDKATKLAIKKALDNFIVAVAKRAQEMEKKSSNSSNKLSDSENSYEDENIIQEEVPAEDTSLNIVAEDEDTAAEKPLVNIVVSDDEIDNANIDGNNGTTPTKIISY